jgi:hypothetical protein
MTTRLRARLSSYHRVMTDPEVVSDALRLPPGMEPDPSGAGLASELDAGDLPELDAIAGEEGPIASLAFHVAREIRAREARLRKLEEAPVQAFADSFRALPHQASDLSMAELAERSVSEILSVLEAALPDIDARGTSYATRASDVAVIQRAVEALLAREQGVLCSDRGLIRCSIACAKPRPG